MAAIPLLIEDHLGIILSNILGVDAIHYGKSYEPTSITLRTAFWNLICAMAKMRYKLMFEGCNITLPDVETSPEPPVCLENLPKQFFQHDINFSTPKEEALDN